LEALEAFGISPAPAHLSNSTDALQPLEQEHRHTLFTLEKLIPTFFGTARCFETVEMSASTISVSSQTHRSPARANSSTMNIRVGCVIAFTTRTRASYRARAFVALCLNWPSAVSVATQYLAL
jgi:hypothetical protein